MTCLQFKQTKGDVVHATKPRDHNNNNIYTLVHTQKSFKINIAHFL